MSNTDIKAYEQEDSNQIVNASKELIQALVYINKKGNKELSYTGIQWIAQRMAEHGQPLKTLDAKIELVKHDIKDRSQWIWYSTAKVENVGTGAVTIGVSESPFLKYYIDRQTNQHVYTDYDEFGRTKAHGKAVRNAMRQLIPVIEIDNMIKNCTEQQIKHIEDNNANNTSSTSGTSSTSSTSSGTHSISNNTSKNQTRSTDNQYGNQSNTSNKSSATQSTMSKTPSNTPSNNITNNTSNTSHNQSSTNSNSNDQSNSGMISPTQRQIKYLKALGYTGDIPLSIESASKLIQDLKSKKKQS